MTAARPKHGACKRRSGYALRPAATLTLVWSVAGAGRCGADRAHDRRGRHSAVAAAGRARPVGDASPHPLTLARDQLVLWSIRIPRIAAAAMVGAPARGVRRHHAGAVPQSAGRSGAGRRLQRRRVRGGRGDRVHRQPISARACTSCRTSCCRSRPSVGSLATTIVLYSHRQPLGPHVDRDLPAGGLAIAAIANAGIGLLVFIADDRQLRDITFWMLGSLSGATWPKVATLAPVLALAADRLRLDRARARCAGARRGRGVSQRRRRRAAEADFDRAGVGDDRRRGLGLRRHRLCRHRRAASAAAGDRAGASAAAAGLGAARRGAAGRAPIRWRAPSWRPPKCRSAS